MVSNERGGFVSSYPRQLAEKAILENLGNEVVCKEILETAYKAGLFTSDEVEKLVSLCRNWGRLDADIPDGVKDLQKAVSKALLDNLGPFPALTLRLLIGQLPSRVIEGSSFRPDVKEICKAMAYDDKAFYLIVNTLVEKGLLHKNTVGRKLVLTIDFRAISELSGI